MGFGEVSRVHSNDDTTPGEEGEDEDDGFGFGFGSAVSRSWGLGVEIFGDGCVGAHAFGGSVALMFRNAVTQDNLCIVVLVNDLSLDSSNTREVLECVLRHQDMSTDVLNTVFSDM